MHIQCVSYIHVPLHVICRSGSIIAQFVTRKDIRQKYHFTMQP